MVARVARLRAAARFLDEDVAQQQVEDLAERTRDGSDVVDVVDGDEVVGLAWLDLVVNDLALDDPARVAELVPALVARARSARARMLGVAIHPGDPSRAALGEQPGFESRATNMALPLDGEIGDPGGLELRRMTDAEFDGFLSGNAEEYAGELVATGIAYQVGMFAWMAVGSLWLCTLDPMAFVYDVVVDGAQRRKGYGAAIMNAGALWCREQGHPVLGLNVFAHNPGARALYDRLGYVVTQDYLALDVPDAG